MGKNKFSSATEYFIDYLQKLGYGKFETNHKYADIVAYKDNQRYYFEIKRTSKPIEYFGASTLTELNMALKCKNSNYYKFVIIKDITENKSGRSKKKRQFIHKELTLQELMKYSTIPPFKAFFKVEFDNIKTAEISDKPKGSTDSVRLTEDNLKSLIKFYKEDLLGKMEEESM